MAKLARWILGVFTLFLLGVVLVACGQAEARNQNGNGPAHIEQASSSQPQLQPNAELTQTQSKQSPSKVQGGDNAALGEKKVTQKKASIPKSAIPYYVQEAVRLFPQSADPLLQEEWIRFVEKEMPFVRYMMYNERNKVITYLDYREQDGKVVVEVLLCYGFPGCREEERDGEVQLTLFLKEKKLWKGEHNGYTVTGFTILSYKYYTESE